jgi:hypothetical protein
LLAGVPASRPLFKDVPDPAPPRAAVRRWKAPPVAASGMGAGTTGAARGAGAGIAAAIGSTEMNLVSITLSLWNLKSDSVLAYVRRVFESKKRSERKPKKVQLVKKASFLLLNCDQSVKIMHKRIL